MIRKIGRRAAVAVVAIALAASGSALFGATALAHGKSGGKGGQHRDNYVVVIGGSGGKAGTAEGWCLIAIAGGIGILGNGSGDGNMQCNASSSGGSGVTAVSY